ncbi:MAG: hypothetical protein JNM77_08695 [Pseudonocardia sp.]|nr:hypothetical protein [Pseudonocardia sp.]
MLAAIYQVTVPVSAEYVLASAVDVVPLAEDEARRRIADAAGERNAGAATMAWEVEVWTGEPGERKRIPWQTWQRGGLAPPGAWMFILTARTSIVTSAEPA